MTTNDRRRDGEAQNSDADASADKQELCGDDPVMGRLKALYDDVAAEPLPNDLLALLDKLDKVERSR